MIFHHKGEERRRASLFHHLDIEGGKPFLKVGNAALEAGFGKLFQNGFRTLCQYGDIGGIDGILGYALGIDVEDEGERPVRERGLIVVEVNDEVFVVPCLYIEGDDAGTDAVVDNMQRIAHLG